MKKPTKRREILSFVEIKMGVDFAQNFYKFTDKEVKDWFNANYKWLKKKEDYIGTHKYCDCIRCGKEVIHHHECDCGEDRAVFDDWGWKDDIESNTDRLPGDEEFIANGYKSEGLV